MEAIITSGTIRVGVAATIPGLLRDFGVSIERASLQAGLPADFLDDAESTIPFAALGRFLAVCVALTGCPHFGLIAGERTELSAMGRVGFLVRHSASVRSALETLIAYTPFNNQGSVASFESGPELSSLGYAVLQPAADGAGQILAAGMAIARNIMRCLCGPDWCATEVALALPEPADLAPYARVFRAPVRFGAERSSLAFPIRWLDRPVPGAEPQLRRLLADQLSSENQERGRDLSSSVTRVIRGLLGTSRCSSADIASLFDLTERSLQRRLADESTTFKALLEQVRRQEAARLLEHTALPLSELAARLGYSEPSAFTRAFHRWQGVPPLQWRTAVSRGAPSGNPQLRA